MTAAAELDLGLLKRELCGMSDQDPPYPVFWVAGTAYDEETRVNGIDWPQHALTMIGLARLDHLQQCVEQVLDDGVPGDWAETGCWRGGCCILMRAVLKARGITDRAVWVIDSFAGLPPDAAAEGFSGSEQALLAVPLEQVRGNFAACGLLDGQVRFVPGWFADTLPGSDTGPLAVLRMDADLYSSTMTVLDHLYPRLSPGGYAIIDDWQLPARRAAEDYRAAHGITEPVHPVPGSTYRGQPVSAYWRREMP